MVIGQGWVTFHPKPIAMAEKYGVLLGQGWVTCLLRVGSALGIAIRFGNRGREREVSSRNKWNNVYPGQCGSVGWSVVW